jgi:hypothetical protein
VQRLSELRLQQMCAIGFPRCEMLLTAALRYAYLTVCGRELRCELWPRVCGASQRIETERGKYLTLVNTLANTLDVCWCFGLHSP